MTHLGWSGKEHVFSQGCVPCLGDVVQNGSCGRSWGPGSSVGLPPFAQRPKAGSAACLHQNHLLGLWAGPGLCWDGAWAPALRTKSSEDLSLQGRGCQAPSLTGASQPSLEFAARPQFQHQGRGAVREDSGRDWGKLCTLTWPLPSRSTHSTHRQLGVPAGELASHPELRGLWDKALFPLVPPALTSWSSLHLLSPEQILPVGPRPLLSEHLVRFLFRISLGDLAFSLTRVQGSADWQGELGSLNF